MGNSNSSGGAATAAHHQQQNSLQWSHSLDGGAPDSRNRMKSGYFPPRHYMGHSHGGMVPPQKVLPTVNPAKEALRLKPTSNGAILHKGGTISGRKIQQLAELEQAEQIQQMDESSSSSFRRKRHLSASSILHEGEEVGLVSSADFQRRSQRSISGHTINFERGNIIGKPSSMSGNVVPNGRDYDSEPDIRDDSNRRLPPHHHFNESPERSISPLPNSFTLIQESPAKKQIRTKKKYQAPPPPPTNTSAQQQQQHSNINEHSIPSGFEFHDPHRLSNHPHGGLTPTSSSNNSGKKKLQRLFKTKAQSKQIQREEEQRITTTTMETITTTTTSVHHGVSSPSQMQIPHVRITRNSHNYSSKQWELAELEEQQQLQQSTKKTGNEQSEGRRQSSNEKIAATAAAAAAAVAAAKKKKPLAPLATKEDNHAAAVVVGDDNNGRRTPLKNSVISGRQEQNNTADASSKNGKSHDVTDSSAVKKTFYFGMGSSELLTFTKKAQSHRRAEETLLEGDDTSMKVALSASNNNSSNAKWNNNKQTDKNNKGNLGQRSSSHSQQQQQQQPKENPQDELSKVMQLRAASVNKALENQQSAAAATPPPPPPPQLSKQQSGVEGRAIKSKNISQRSDSDSDGFNRNNSNKAHRKISRDSSSDLSSSDVDIPILIRPTLPQRRLDLPRFSPSAAWRALDSPRASGRSLSSEDGFTYEDRIQRYTRPSAPPRTNNERSGDSGISAGDAGSPANAPPDHLGRHSSCSLSIGGGVGHDMSNTSGNFKSKLRKIRGDSPGKSDQKCWTPEQDLDESSSEFEHDVELGPVLANESVQPKGKNGNVPIGLQTPPKFTTRSNLFSSEYDGESNNSGGRLYTRSSKVKNSTIVDISNDPESRRVIHHRVIGKNRFSPTNQQQQQQPYSLDTNWFLSRSEPNSLNVLGMNEKNNNGAKLSVAEPCEITTDYIDKAFATESPSRLSSSRHHHRYEEGEDKINGYHHHHQLQQHEVRSEIGYGPSSMNFLNGQQQQSTSQSPFYDEDCKSNSLVFRRPFSHIMYLPSYDSRKFYQHPSASSHYSRRTKSVDNLDASESHRLYRRTDEGQRRFGSQTHLNGHERMSRRDLHEVGREQQSLHFTRTQSVPLYKQQSSDKPRVIEHKIHLENDNSESMSLQQQQQLEQEKENKRKKFKFQSTLRVMERKKIEAQLSREAEEKEKQRLREIEALRQVEEEFQRKRLQKQQQSNEVELSVNGTSSSNGAHKSQTENWDDVHRNNFKNKFEPSPARGKSVEKSSISAGSVVTSHTKSSSKASDKVSSKSSSAASSNKMHLTKRQEPEGAPSFSANTDLRKELIHASRKRNALSAAGSHQSSNGHGGGGGSDLTQELSEYRQETRQYCDYRRSGRPSSASPARYVVETSSDIFPLSRRTPVERCKQNRYRATVHPEIVCDIPVKPFPYMVNFSSRLSGSTSNLLVEERPGLGLGYGGNGLNSGPPSVISDNYRRDWAHHVRGSGSSTHGGGPGRASSIASLHSAPGFTSDNLRHSVTDLTAQESPSVTRTRKSPLFHKYSSSPPSSPLPPFSSSISEVTDHDKDGSSIITSTNGGPSSGIFQLQPYNKTKGYRPVAFKPPTGNAPIKLTSTTVK